MERLTSEACKVKARTSVVVSVFRLGDPGTAGRGVELRIHSSDRPIPKPGETRDKRAFLSLIVCDLFLTFHDLVICSSPSFNSRH